MHRNLWLRALTRRLFVRPSSSSSKYRPSLNRVRLGLEPLEHRLTPSTVINVNDPSGGMDNPANVTVATLGSNVTLRDAINAADNSGGSGSYLINLPAGKTITFTSPVNNTTITSNNTVQNQNWYGPDALPAITSNITIKGNGDTLQMASGATMRFFYVSGGPSLTGGALSSGTLELDNLTLQGGVAQGGSGSGGGLGAGGAIFNQGNLTLNGDTLTNNQAIGGNGGMGGGGGGMWSNIVSGSLAGGGFGGDFSITGGPTGGSGDASGNAGGGAGFLSTANGSNASSTQAGAGGGLGGFGGAGGGGAVSDTGSSTPGGGAGDGGGGGLGSAPGGSGGGFGGGGLGGSPSGSYAGGGGGGVGGGGGGAVFGTLFAPAKGSGGGGGFGGGGGAGLSGGAGGFGGGGGSASSTNGGIPGMGGFGGGPGGGGGAGMGGGIFNMFGTLTITNSTLSDNTAQGGTHGYLGGSGLGGALFNLDGKATLTGVNLTNNNSVIDSQAAAASANGSAVYNLALGNTVTTGGTTTATMILKNCTVVAGNGGNVFVNDVDSTKNPNTAVFDTYDAQNRLTGIYYPNGNVYERVYKSDGSSTATLTNPYTNTVSSGETSQDWIYNVAGQITKFDAYYTNNNVFTRTYNYDSTTGNLTGSSATLTNSKGPISPGISSEDWTYNAAGRITVFDIYYTNNNIFTRTYTYDKNGNSTGSTAKLTNSSGTVSPGVTSDDYTYDNMGNLTITHAYYTNGNVYERDYTYDSSGNLTGSTAKMTNPVTGTINSNGVTEQDWTYNAAGQITKLTMNYTSGNFYERDYTYDSKGKSTGSTANLTNSSGTVSPGVTSDSYSYNVAGQILSAVADYTNGNVNTRTYTYDKNGNLTGSTATTVTNGGKGSTILSYTYNAQNQLTSLGIASNSDVLSYSYDPNTGVLTSATLKDFGGNTVATYSYNQGQLSSVTYTYNGNVVSYSYDSNGVLLSTTTKNSGGTPLSTVNYNSQGQITTVDDGSGKLSATYTYSTKNQISNISYANGNSLSYSYTGDGSAGQATLTNKNNVTLQVEKFDVLGRLTEIDSYTNNSPNGNVYTRTYDSDGDGTSYATLTNTNTNTILDYYEYDTQGNLTYGPSPTQPSPWPPS